MARPDILVAGNCYFSVGFYDRDLLLPRIDTLLSGAVLPTDAEFGSLSGEIAKFLADPEYVSLTITIRFTDDGLSLGRTDNGCQIHFFTQPRLDPDEDSKILSFFAELDLRPTEDYFFDGGRTRVLDFAISGDLDSIVQLCRRVLTEVYALRQGDVVDYHFRRTADLIGKEAEKPE